MAESPATTLKAVSVLRAPCGGQTGDEISFETVLEAAIFKYNTNMDHMSHRRAPKARTNDLQLAFSSTWVAL